MAKTYYVLTVPAEEHKKDLGPSIFYDPTSGLMVTSKDPANPVEFEGQPTKKMLNALKNGHIREVDAPGAKAKGKVAKAAETKTPDPVLDAKPLAEMTDEELLAYYKENWDVSAKDEKAFLKMTTAEKVEFLTEE